MAGEALIYDDAPGALPASYRVPPGLVVRLSSVSATFNGAAAASAYLACLSIYSQDGKLIGRYFPDQLNGGDSGEVTFAPFLGGNTGGISPSVAQHGASAYSTGIQTAPGSSVVTPVNFGATTFDTDGYWDVANPSRLTIPTGLGGTYFINARNVISYVTADTEYDNILLVNGARTAGFGSYTVGLSTAAVGSVLPGIWIWPLVAGDYVEMGHSHTIAADRSMPAQDNWLQVALLGSG